MRTVLGRVLVIEDDPFMLKIICSLLEQSGFHVVARESAHGAAQVILHERIDAAVIDWNLPTLQGDDVIRLLRTWDEAKDLPVLLITGAPEQTLATIRAELPGIHVLSKAQLREQLLSTLGAVVGSGNTVRGLAPVTLSPEGDVGSAPPPRRQASELVPQLLGEISAAVKTVDGVWSAIERGRAQPARELVRTLDRLAGQAELLALDEASEVLRELGNTLRALPQQRKVPRELRRAVERGSAALSVLPQTGTGALTIPPEPLIGALRKARAELTQSAQ